KISIIIIMIMIMLTKNQNVCNDHHDHYAKPYLVHPSIEPTVLSSCNTCLALQFTNGSRGLISIDEKNWREPKKNQFHPL
ncbi:hypothetical protein DERF_008019, partial [Dermatophagoides farinae]